jgi:hypothetical protein
MDRKLIDCRTMPSERNCSLTIAGTEDEVLDAATDHAVNAHGHERTAELQRAAEVGNDGRRTCSRLTPRFHSWRDATVGPR